MDEDRVFWFRKIGECSLDLVVTYVLHVACFFFCCLSICLLIAAALARIPMKDVTDMPPELDDYNRVDLASLRHVLLEGVLWFPPPPAPPVAR